MINTTSRSETYPGSGEELSSGIRQAEKEMQRLSEIGAKLLAEPFSEATRKARDRLIIISALSLATSLALIDQKRVEAFGFTFREESFRTIKTALAAFLVYHLLLFLAHVFRDVKKKSYEDISAAAYAQVVHSEVVANYERSQQELEEIMRCSQESFKRGEALYQEREEISASYDKDMETATEQFKKASSRAQEHPEDRNAYRELDEAFDVLEGIREKRAAAIAPIEKAIEDHLGATENTDVMAQIRKNAESFSTRKLEEIIKPFTMRNRLLAVSIISEMAPAVAIAIWAIYEYCLSG